MEQLKYSRINWTIEIIIILVIFLQLIILDQNNSRQDAFVAFIIYWIIYFNLSIVMYYSLSPSVLFKNSDNPKADENKFELTPSEVLAYIKKGILFTSLCKLCLLLIPAFLSISLNDYFCLLLYDISHLSQKSRDVRHQEQPLDGVLVG